MTVPGNIVPLLMSEDAAAGGYQVSRSLRFNSADSAYLERVVSVAGDRAKWTLSFWIKRSKLGTSQDIFSAGTSGTDILYFTSGDALALDRPGATVLTTTQVFRDVSAWYHIVLAVDAANGTNSNKAKLYVNGSEITAYSTDNRSGVGSTSFLTNTATTHRIGVRSSNNTVNPCDMYLADVYLLDGTTTDPSTFAQTDAVTGQWVPKTPASISYGTNGFRLTFSDNSGTTSTTLGKDSAGSNNWSPNNFSVASGSGNDSLVDSPTSYGTDTGAGGEVRGNYCTLNPLFALASLTLTNGNLETSSPGAAWRNAKGTFAMTTGKWYWEHTVPTTGAADGYIGGVATATADYSSSSTGIWGRQGTTKYSNGSSSTPFGSTTSGDILGFAFDADAGKLWVAQNGTWVGDPGAGTGESWSGIPSGVFPYVAAYNQANVVNFGQRAFAYTNNRSGFKALCDTNLTSPTIARPSTVMDVVLYSGTGSSQTVTGLNFNPDFVWLKRRSSAQAHYLYDVIRGTSSVLYSDGTDAEQSISTGLTAFNSNGFSLGSLSGVNASSTANVAWAWDAGTSTVTNNNGSISSQVRANASAGFSVVSVPGYTYPTKIAGHGLNVEPHFIISKNRGVSNPWMIYHKAAGANTYFQFDTGAGYTGVPGVWSGVNSTVFPINSGINQQTDIIAYCFAPVANYSSMGSYVGDGSTSGFGPFIHCGFRPKFILIKGSTVAYSWLMFDSVRNPYNLTTQVLYADSSTSEMTNNGTGSGGYESIDILSNGFQIKSNSSRYNQSGATYIYFAVAESPFQYARAR